MAYIKNMENSEGWQEYGATVNSSHSAGWSINSLAN